MTRILVIEDNPDLAFGLRNNLEIEGYEVEVAADGAVGLERAGQSRPDLVVLDLMLPRMDGFRVLKSLRDGGFVAPVLVLTARGDESDKVRGLRLGADDYVTKPFGLLELLARIEALLRRAGRPAAPDAEAGLGTPGGIGGRPPPRAARPRRGEGAPTPPGVVPLVATVRRGRPPSRL